MTSLRTTPSTDSLRSGSAWASATTAGAKRGEMSSLKRPVPSGQNLANGELRPPPTSMTCPCSDSISGLNLRVSSSRWALRVKNSATARSTPRAASAALRTAIRMNHTDLYDRLLMDEGATSTARAGLRYGVMIRSTVLRRWQAEVIETLDELDGVRPALLIVDNRKPPSRASGDRIRRLAASRHLLWDLYNNGWVARRAVSLQPVDLAAAWSEVPRLEVGVEKRGFGEYFSDEAVERIRARPGLHPALRVRHHPGFGARGCPTWHLVVPPRR